MLQKLKHLWKGLKDFFQYQYNRLLKKPVYPKAIIPKRTFKLQIDIDAISESVQLYVVRRADGDCNDLFTDTGIIKEEYLKPREASELSMNLFGAFYKPRHLKFTALKKGSEDWNGQRIYLADFANDYTTVSTFCPLIYELNSLHNQEVPSYSQYNPKDKTTADHIKVNKLINEVVENQYKVQGKAIIIHKPTNLNYWHVELHIQLAPHKEVLKKESNQFARSARSYVVEQLLSVPMFELPKRIQAIDKSFYKTGSGSF